MIKLFKGLFYGFRDFLRFSFTINELNHKVNSAIIKHNKKSKSMQYSRWIQSGSRTKAETPVTQDLVLGIYYPLKKMYLYDAVLFFITMFLIFICSTIWNSLKVFLGDYLSNKWISLWETILNIFIQLIWRLAITVIIELINMLHIKQLTSKIHIMLDESLSDKKGQTSQNAMNVNQSLIMSRLHTYAFFIVFPLQISILDWILPFQILKSLSLLLHNSLLYSFYSFDHIWSRENVYFEQRLQKMIYYMPYFIGYGFSVGIIQMMWPDPISVGSMLTIFLYPLLVVNAYRVDWKLISTLKVGRFFIFLGKWFLKPSLVGCQMICCFIDKLFEYFSK